MKTEGIIYAEDVLSGKIISGKLLKLACKRFLNDIERTDLQYLPEKAERVKRFISLFHHFTGKFDKKPFKLLPWQAFFVENLYSFYWLDGRRRFTTAFLLLARKGGKTAFSAALCLYHLLADGEPDANVFLAAPSRAQAKIAYKAVREFSKQLDPKEQVYTCLRDEIKFNNNPNFLKVLASDSSKLDGYNPSFYLIDEMHELPDSSVRDVLKSGTGMRVNPMEILISTAGFNLESPCYLLRNSCIDLLNGMFQDDSLFAMIFEMDDEDDWREESNWYKSQPNLGITVTLEYMRSEIGRAINIPSEEVNVRTKLLNTWVQSSKTWIQEDYIIESSKSFNLDSFTGCNCYVGVDLSSVSDLTAVSIMLIKDGKYYFKTFYFLPSESIKKVSNNPYNEWVRKGLLTITPGNVTDYDYIEKLLLDLSEKNTITVISYDQWNSTQFAISATEKGLPLKPYSQTIGAFNKPTKELERIILSGNAIIDNNEITRYCFRNVVLKIDHNQNCKPVKYSESKKIDGVISILMSLAGYLNTEHYTGEVFTF